jgi:hypothetical protein
MSSVKFRSSRPDPWFLPRAHQDPAQRRRIYGPLLPMEPPTLWERLLRAR